MKRRFHFAAAALAVVAPLCWLGAATAAEMPKGTIEFKTSAMYDHSSYSSHGLDVASTTQIEVDGGVGFCVTGHLELAASLILVHQAFSQEGEPSTDATAYGGGASVLFNFTTQSSIVPYLEAGASLLAYGGDVADDLETTWVLPVVGTGIRFLVTESSAITTGVYYRHLSDAQGIHGMDANSISLSVGLSILLR